jgi:hypothetical protein
MEFGALGYFQGKSHYSVIGTYAAPFLSTHLQYATPGNAFVTIYFAHIQCFSVKIIKGPHVYANGLRCWLTVSHSGTVDIHAIIYDPRGDSTGSTKAMQEVASIRYVIRVGVYIPPSLSWHRIVTVGRNRNFTAKQKYSAYPPRTSPPSTSQTKTPRPL